MASAQGASMSSSTYRRGGTVPDLVFVLLSIALFVGLALAVKGAERL
jgi:hypothetical protein